jgi:hypothetical protein
MIEAKGEALKTYRGRFGNVDVTLLREFELEAVQATFS